MLQYDILSEIADEDFGVSAEDKTLNESFRGIPLLNCLNHGLGGLRGFMVSII